MVDVADDRLCDLLLHRPELAALTLLIYVLVVDVPAHVVCAIDAAAARSEQ
jgi:hypothetical protein